MHSPSRRISTRLEVEPGKQSLDVILIGLSGTFYQTWHDTLASMLSLDENIDRLVSVDEYKLAIDAAHESIAPVIVIDLNIVNSWGVEKIGNIFDATGPVSAVVAVSESKSDDEYARVTEHFVLDGYYSGTPDTFSVKAMVGSTREKVYLRGRIGEGKNLTRPMERLKKLNRVGIALSQVRDLSSLLNMILRECIRLLDADAGSIYILESKKDKKARRKKVLGRVQRKSKATAVRVATKIAEGQYNLHFAAARNDSVHVPFTEITFPADLTSIAGFCALRGEVVNLDDVYKIPDDALYTFNPEIVDKKYGYRCVSMLSIPMRNMRDEVVGVIQLINKKRNPTQLLNDPETTPNLVETFGPDDLDLALSLGNQAGTAIENVRLNDSINDLFESFVDATVRSIEQRDPSTAGHSARVDRITVFMADVVRKKEEGPYKDVWFTDEELVELHYASILHDVGKIGVREHILTKAKKLFPYQHDVVEVRAGLIESSIRQRAYAEMNSLLKGANGKDANSEIEKIEADCEAAVSLLRNDFQFVMHVNEPGFLKDEEIEELKQVFERTHPVVEGTPKKLITEDEYYSLSTRKGSLSPEERSEIESHVLKSRKFLEKIPWTHELEHIPEIAGAHHEKMSGKGYPDGIPAAETYLQSRIMAVADVFDSLTAADRPYKPAIPLERALEILQTMSKYGELDPDVVNLFIDDKIWEQLNLKVIYLKDANEAQRNAK